MISTPKMSNRTLSINLYRVRQAIRAKPVVVSAVLIQLWQE